MATKYSRNVTMLNELPDLERSENFRDATGGGAGGGSDDMYQKFIRNFSNSLPKDAGMARYQMGGAENPHTQNENFNSMQNVSMTHPASFTAIPQQHSSFSGGGGLNPQNVNQMSMMQPRSFTATAIPQQHSTFNGGGGGGTFSFGSSPNMSAQIAQEIQRMQNTIPGVRVIPGTPSSEVINPNHRAPQQVPYAQPYAQHHPANHSHQAQKADTRENFYDSSDGENKDNGTPYTPLSCIEVSEHISNCPICKKFYRSDNTLFIVFIVFLLVIIALLVKKIFDK
jgi:hypothetical protein